MTHVAVIGAGILGAALADALARRGAAVTVVDSRAPGSGTSGTSLAWLNANEKLPRHYHDLSVRAMTQWRQLAQTFADPSWYVPTGSLTWAETDAERDALGRRLERLREWGYPAEELTAGQAADLEPALRPPDGGQIAYFPAEGFVHGDRAVDALLSRARAAGTRLVTADGDVTLESRGSAIAAIRLPDGGRIDADVYVCCAGWRTLRLLEPVGVTVPLIPGDAPGSTAVCLVTRVPGTGLISRVMNTPGLSLRPLWQGGVQLEASDVNGVVDAHTAQPVLDGHGAELMNRAGKMLAGFTADAPRHRLCIRPLPADGHPIVGSLPDLDNAYLSVTHSGMTLAPELARLAADDILDETSGRDLEPYRPTRFARAGGGRGTPG